VGVDFGLGEGKAAGDGGTKAGLEGDAWRRPLGDVQALRNNAIIGIRRQALVLIIIRVVCDFLGDGFHNGKVISPPLLAGHRYLLVTG
jgi:hypothetical protein